MTGVAIAQIIAGFGSLAVAIAVFLSNRQQNRIANRISVRSAEVEDQKFRLALLDRRLVAITAMRRSREAFWSEGIHKPTAVAEMRAALEMAEVVFEREERQAIGNALDELHRLSLLNARLEIMKDGSDRSESAPPDAFSAALKLRNEAYIAAGDSMTPVIARLEKAARVAPVPPLVL